MLPTLKKKCRLVFAGLAICLSASFFSAYAQPAAPMFQVIHLPRKAGYSKEKLNTELAALKDKEAVKKLLRSKNFPAQTSIVIYISRPGAQTAYWNINTSSPTDKEDSRIILQSRDNATTKIFKLSEFKTFFKDTVAVIDTLSMELLIKDADYPDDQYVLVTACNKTVSEKNVPLHSGKLLFTKDLVKACDEKPLISMINRGNQYRVLAALFALHFLTEEEKEELLSIAGFIKKQAPEKDIKDVALSVYNYAAQHYGRLHFLQLTNWLQKNTAALNGDHQ